MPALTADERASLGPIIEPFERNPRKTKDDLKDGERHREEFEQFIHDGIDNKKPESRYIELTTTEIEEQIKVNGRFTEKSFLWVIDEVSIKMIREKTPNSARRDKPELVCHTNITGCGKAFAGGELFFGEDGKIYINPFSDRYGQLSEKQWQAVLSYFKKAGYKEIVDITEFID